MGFTAVLKNKHFKNISKDQDLEREKLPHEPNLKLAHNLIQYFYDRKNLQTDEMLKLIKITSNAIKNYSDEDLEKLKEIIHHNLDEDIFKMKKLNNEIKKDLDPHQFRKNKLLDLLVQSKKYFDLNWPSIREGYSDKLLNSSNDISWYGTSMLNYMQTTMLEILSVIFSESISDLNCLKKSNIYQIETSPNIQSCYVTQTNASEEDKKCKYEIMKDWRWSTEDKMQTIESKTLKLVVPSLGFTWGGSRFEKEFKEKRFKLHDASSFVGECLNFEYLTTELIKNYVGLLGPNDDFHIQLGLQGLKNICKWRNDVVLPEPGYIFLKGSYCGFVIEVDSEKHSITVLGFNRWMPFIEGFIKETFEMNDGGKWFRLYEQSFVSELSIFVGETNENNTNLPISPDPVYFFEVLKTDIKIF